MTRLPLTFACGSLTLAGTLDTAPGTTGLLIVSGGNEIRSGAFAGQARLAARIARSGFPVLRFDRRGIGDSEGDNRGFRHSGRDIAAALDAFKAMAPQVERVVAFGNCDAASALMLSQGEGFEGLILSNPWVLEDANADALPPPSAIRARYLEKLKSPREIWRLLSGGVNLRKLAKGLSKSVKHQAEQSSLATAMQSGLEGYAGNVRILLAGADRTAQAFEAEWDQSDARIERCTGASHAYAEPEHFDWLEAQVLAALRA
jgi:exosortase A-associated hydrolase 1